MRRVQRRVARALTVALCYGPLCVSFLPTRPCTIWAWRPLRAVARGQQRTRWQHQPTAVVPQECGEDHLQAAGREQPVSGVISETQTDIAAGATKLQSRRLCVAQLCARWSPGPLCAMSLHACSYFGHVPPT